MTLCWSRRRRSGWDLGVTKTRPPPAPGLITHMSTGRRSGSVR